MVYKVNSSTGLSFSETVNAMHTLKIEKYNIKVYFNFFYYYYSLRYFKMAINYKQFSSIDE